MLLRHCFRASFPAPTTELEIIIPGVDLTMTPPLLQLPNPLRTNRIERRLGSDVGEWIHKERSGDANLVVADERPASP